MTAAKDTYASTLAAAAVTKTASITTNQMAQQETINAAGCNVGFHQGVSTSSSATYEAAVKAANAAKAAADFSAEQLKQATISAARETLRTAVDGSGESASF